MAMRWLALALVGIASAAYAQEPGADYYIYAGPGRSCVLRWSGGNLECNPHPTDGGLLLLQEGADDGGDFFGLEVPDAGLTTGLTCTLQTDGRLPDSCIGNGTDDAGGTPGGNANELQYNQASALGGIANLETDGTHPYFVPVTSHPAASASGVKQYAYRTGSAEPSVPRWMPSAPAIPNPGAPFSLGSSDGWRCLTAATNGGIPIAAFRTANTATAGTLGQAGWATTSLLTRTTRVQFRTAASANSSAGVRPNDPVLWLGNAADKGGFTTYTRAALSAAAANQRVFVGISAAGFPSATADPSAALNTAYFGCDAADTNLAICANDASSTAGCTTLGSNYPCNTSGAFYEFWLWAEPNAGTSISYAVNRLDSAQSTSGSVPTSGGTPSTTTQLVPNVWINTGSGSSALDLHFAELCWLAGW